MVDDDIMSAVYDLNALLLSYSDDIVSIDLRTSGLTIFQKRRKDKPKNEYFVEMRRQFTYDIQIPNLRTLERLDSLFLEKIKLKYRLFSVSYYLQDSTGKIIQNYLRGKLSDHSIKGRTIILGFFAKYILNFEYEYPIRMFIGESLHALILVCGLFFLFVSCFLSLVQIIRREKRRMERLELTIYSIVHNLRAPINNVITARHCLNTEMEKKMGEYEIHLIELMQDQLMQASNIITRLLNLSRAFQIIKIDIQSIHFPEFVQNIVARYSMLVPRGKKIEFFTNLEMQDPRIEIDPNHLTEIMQNLIDNSIKYSGDKVRIEITCAESEKYIVIHFIDDGDGIKKEARKNVFKPYYRDSEVNGVKGYGLGLFYVKSAIEAHGGIIKINEEKKRGTEFIILLPRK